LDKISLKARAEEKGERRIYNIAGGWNLKIWPTRANSWRRPRFLNRARLTGCLVPFLFSVLPEAFLVGFPRIQWAIFDAGAQGVPCFIGRQPDPVDNRLDEV